MATPRSPSELDDLERELAQLAGDVAFPSTPAFAFPASSISASTRRWPVRWKAGVVAASLLIVTTLAVPVARDAVADWLGFTGIQIQIGHRINDPPATVTSIGGSLLLGEATTLREAEAAMKFNLLTPTAGPEVVEPEVYLNSFQGAAVVSLVYLPSAALPEIGETGVGMLLMQIDAAGTTSMFMTKRAVAESPPQPVTIDGTRGMWIRGGVLMTDAGDPFWTYQRRSGNVLIWERDGVTYRMESDLPLDDAVAVAESLEPIEVAS